jgi:ubiquinone biosynthesis protein COQ9
MTGATPRNTHREALRERLLEAMLPHVPFDGWTHAALRAGAEDAGIAPATAAGLFPGGAGEMVELFNKIADRRMLEALEARDLAEMKVRERIATAIRLRLEQNAAHREAIRLGLSILAMPQNAALAARCLYRTVNAIWYAAGDTSTDYNFYTKRGLLAGVYGSTVLYWLNDRSDGFSDSWDFLDRRIADVMRVPQAIGRIGRIAEHLPNPLRLLRRPTVR